MERSTSPYPNIQRTLFQLEAPPNDSKSNRKRSSRPRLQDDLKKASTSALLGPDHDKENLSIARRFSRKVSKSGCSSPSSESVKENNFTRSRGLSARQKNSLPFQFKSI
eukprot:TRINITY_DN19607_c0_g1_i1.p1 TRINITY_DN19607_c0_g1~~TRINITY_DN19607_c0_g1_i1.p1  ORF type:complete len:109 (+),score=4.30 TRINITY_DN19607_c0_g1_i1:58-384(+)